MSANWKNKRDAKWSDLSKNKLSKNSALSRHSKRKRRKILKKTYPDKYRLPRTYSWKKLRSPAPLIDIFEGIEDIVVIAGFAGITSENLKIHVNDQRLILNVRGSHQNYYKNLNLPTKVISTNMQTKYKNGVLEIKLKKKLIQQRVN